GRACVGPREANRRCRRQRRRGARPDRGPASDHPRRARRGGRPLRRGGPRSGTRPDRCRPGEGARPRDRRACRRGEARGACRGGRGTRGRGDELRSGARYLGRTAMLLDGFRDHLVGRVGPELSREAEALFRELTNHEYDDLRIDEESLAIQIADVATYFAVERFSGSEADLANLALRVAISTHLSRVSGADLGMLVLDEAFGALD